MVIPWPSVVGLCVVSFAFGAGAVCILFTWADAREARARREAHRQVRPRFGHVIRADGSKELLVFHPTDHDPNTFRGVDAATELPPTWGEGDVLHFDAIGPNQSVVMDGGPSFHNDRTDREER